MATTNDFCYCYYCQKCLSNNTVTPVMNNHTPTNANKLTKSFLAGATSGAISCILFQPLDLIKTRVQVPLPSYAAKEQLPSTLLRRNILYHTYAVLQKDGVVGFWRGLTPSICRTVPGVGIYFSTLHCMKGLYKSEPTLFGNLFLGFTARAFVGALLLPVAVTKARFESGQFNYKTVPGALLTIWRLEGLRGLFSGCVATIARDAPFSGLYLMFYTQGKKTIASWFHGDLSAEVLFPCGLVSGLLASVLTHPADVIKTQLQLYPSRYNSTIHCLNVVLTKHGLSGLFRGILPRCLRRTLMSALSWTVFESLMKKLQLEV